MEFVPNLAGIAEVTVSPTGMVSRDIQRRTLKVAATAKRLCPTKTGRLRSSIRASFKPSAKGLIGTVGSDVSYAIFVEEDTQAHDIFPVNARVLAFTGKDGQAFAQVVHHPGTKGKHFLRDALKEASV